MDTDNAYSNRDESIKNYAAILFAVLISVIGAFMMTLTSSPQMKGAAMLWIPAALQLIAGVWFGPRRGLLAGGLGAYAAGIIAYGGWGLVDIIMNPIAGGIANSLLPAILFRVFKIDSTFGARPKAIISAIIRIIIVFSLVLSMGLLPLFTNITYEAYLIALLFLLLGMPLILWGININKKHFIIAIFICVFISLISSIIGCIGVVVGGNTIQGAIIGTGIGWFLGDTVSCFMGLYMLAYFTSRAQKMGLCSV